MDPPYATPQKALAATGSLDLTPGAIFVSHTCTPFATFRAACLWKRKSLILKVNLQLLGSPAHPPMRENDMVFHMDIQSFMGVD